MILAKRHLHCKVLYFRSFNEFIQGYSFGILAPRHLKGKLLYKCMIGGELKLNEQTRTRVVLYTFLHDSVVAVYCRSHLSLRFVHCRAKVDAAHSNKLFPSSQFYYFNSSSCDGTIFNLKILLSLALSKLCSVSTNNY